MAWPTYPIAGSRLVSEFRGDFNSIITEILQAFKGSSPPSSPYACQFWVDESVSPKLLKQRNTANTAWVIRARIDTDYGGTLPIAGGTMEGAIDMGGYGITNLPAGSGNAACRYADLAPYAKLDASVAFTGIPSGPDQDPSQNNQFSRKSYVDAKSKEGGAFTAQIVMPYAASQSNHLMRKTEHDTAMAVHDHDGIESTKVKVTNLSAAGGGYTQVPRISGSSVIWGESASIGDGSLANVLDTTVQTVWTEFDCSSYVPSYAKIAILWVYLEAVPSSGYLRLELRRAGSGTSLNYYVQYDAGSYPGNYLSYTLQVLVPLSIPDLIFEHRAIQVGGSGGRDIVKLIGYL